MDSSILYLDQPTGAKRGSVISCSKWPGSDFGLVAEAIARIDAAARHAAQRGSEWSLATERLGSGSKCRMSSAVCIELAANTPYAFQARKLEHDQPPTANQDLNLKKGGKPAYIIRP